VKAEASVCLAVCHEFGSAKLYIQRGRSSRTLALFAFLNEEVPVLYDKIPPPPRLDQILPMLPQISSHFTAVVTHSRSDPHNVHSFLSLVLAFVSQSPIALSLSLSS
jgi:hypothetical protein